MGMKGKRKGGFGLGRWKCPKCNGKDFVRHQGSRRCADVKCMGRN